MATDNETEEITSGEEYIEHEEGYTIPLETETDNENLLQDEEVLSMLTVDDLPIGEYAGIGMIACGAGLLASMGVAVVISILRRGA